MSFEQRILNLSISCLHENRKEFAKKNYNSRQKCENYSSHCFLSKFRTTFYR